MSNLTEEIILTNEKEREKLIDKVEVLNKVKELVAIPNSIYCTKAMVAEYFEIPEPTLDTCIKNNKEELFENGLVKLNKEDFINSFNLSVIDKLKLQTYQGGFEYEGIRFTNNSSYYFNRRAILNVAMLLRDSEIAKLVRKSLLNMSENKEAISNEVDSIINSAMAAFSYLSKDLQEQVFKQTFEGLTNAKKEIGELQEEKKELEGELDTAKDLIETNSAIIDKNGYTIESLAKYLGSTVLIPNMLNSKLVPCGRNLLFKYLRDENILKSNNEPYARYKDWFNVIPNKQATQATGRTINTTLITGDGIYKLVKYMKKDTNIDTTKIKSYEEIINNL
ncbi:MAG: phage antirepressor KilAC domain-containing protein [Clostridium butyricum]|nr:phage antirepressor KilAC domain-containing protein [Clostridium butyricum]